MIYFDGCVDFHDRNNLPSSSGIYFVFDGQAIEYIGQAHNLRVRWKSRSHHKYPDVCAMSSPKIKYIFVNKEELLATEKRLINEFSPRLNGVAPKPMKALNPNRKRKDFIDGIKNNLPRILFEKGLSIGQLSEMTNIKRGTIHNLVLGHTKGFKLDQLSAICRALDIQVGDAYELAGADNE